MNLSGDLQQQHQQIKISSKELDLDTLQLRQADPINLSTFQLPS
jgi:hypothetical protein